MGEVAAAPLRSSLSIDTGGGDADDTPAAASSSDDMPPSPHFDLTAATHSPTAQMTPPAPIPPRLSSSLPPSSHALQQHSAVAEASGGSSAAAAGASPSSHAHAAVVAVRSSFVASAAPMHISLLKEQHKRHTLSDLNYPPPITVAADDRSPALSPTAADQLSPISALQPSPSSTSSASASFHGASSHGAVSRTLPPLESLSPSRSSLFLLHSSSHSASAGKQPRESSSLHDLSMLHSARYSLASHSGSGGGSGSGSGSGSSGALSPSTPSCMSPATSTHVHASHLHVSVPGELDSGRGGKRSSRSVTSWLRNDGQYAAASPAASTQANTDPHSLASPLASPASLATPTSSAAFPALQGAAALTAASSLSASVSAPAAPAGVKRSASFYHFRTPRSRRQTDPTTFRNPLSGSGGDRSHMPPLLLPNTRQHIRSESLLRTITSPAHAQRSLASFNSRTSLDSAAVAEEAMAAEGGDEGDDDPISDYHRYICAEAEAYKERSRERTRLALLQRLQARRRSSVLPVPVFSAHGELERSYVQAQHDKRRKLAIRALTVLPLVHALFQLPLAAVDPAFLYTTCLPLTAVACLLLVAHSVLLRRYPRIGDSDASLDLGLFATTTASTLCSTVALLLGQARGVWWSATDAPLMFVVFLHLYSACILRLAFRLCLLQAAVVLAAYTALDFALSPSSSGASAHRLAVSLSFHVVSLLTLLFFAYRREAHQASDVRQQQYLNQERVKADKLLNSMLPARILVEYLDGRVGHVSAVATIGFVIVELGSLQRRRFHSKSSLTDDDLLGGWAASRSSVSSSPAAGGGGGAGMGGISPTEMIKRLHDTFKRIDAVVSMYASRGVCKIETVSKTYMLCSGLLSDTDDHAAAMLDVCLELSSMIVSRQSSGPKLPVALRIGVATGPVVGGIIGHNRKFFRLFGDTVNVSARMSTTAKPGETMMTESTYEAMDGRQRDMYTIDAPRRLLIKGKGEMTVYRLAGAREEWKPTFSKAVMSRGHEPTSLLQRHSFVYHNLLHMTKLHPLHLAYRTPDTSIEPCFQHEYASLMARQRVKAVTGLLLFAVLVMALSLWQGSSAVLALLAVMIAMIVVQALLSLTRFYVRHFQAVLTVTVCCALAWAVVLECVTTMQSSLSPLLCMQYVVMGLSLLAHLQIRFLLPLVVAAFVAFTVTSLVVDGASVQLVPALASLLCTVVASLVVAWSWERRQRRNFLLAYAMEREQQQMDHFLSNLLPRFVLDVLKNKTTATTSAAAAVVSSPPLPPQQTLAHAPSSRLRSSAVPAVTTAAAGSKSGSAEPSPSESPTSATTANHAHHSPSTRPSTARATPSTATVTPLAASTPSSARPAATGLSTLDSAISSRFAMRFARATVFESDIEGYTSLVSSWSATQVLSLLNRVFSRFDALARRCGVEKIDTIGDAFIVVVFDGRSDPVLDFALSVRRAMAALNSEENARRAAGTREASVADGGSVGQGRLLPYESDSVVKGGVGGVGASGGSAQSSAGVAGAAVEVGRDRASRPASDELSSAAVAAAATVQSTAAAASEAELAAAAAGQWAETTASSRPKHLAVSPAISASPRSTRTQCSVRPATVTPLLLPPVLSALSSPLTSARPPPFQLHLRMGVCTGPAVGGIVGNEVPRFALFGAALDGAIALEQAGRTDEVTVSRSTYDDARDRYEFELSETMAADGQATYRLVGRKEKEE